MKIELSLKDFVFALILIGILVFTWMNIVQIKTEIRYTQNLGVIATQVNQNTQDLAAIKALIQGAQQKPKENAK